MGWVQKGEDEAYVWDNNIDNKLADQLHLSNRPSVLLLL